MSVFSLDLPINWHCERFLCTVSNSPVKGRRKVQAEVQGEWCTIEDAVGMLGCTKWTVRNYILDGTLKAIRSEKNRYLLDRQEVENFSRGYIPQTGRPRKNKFLPNGQLSGETEARVFELLAIGKSVVEIVRIVQIPYDKVQRLYQKSITDFDPDYVTDEEKEKLIDMRISIEKEKASVEKAAIAFQKKALQRTALDGIK